MVSELRLAGAAVAALPVAADQHKPAFAFDFLQQLAAVGAFAGGKVVGLVFGGAGDYLAY
ncbi:hypothetical protein D3C71_1980360 [compost metagenome]